MSLPESSDETISDEKLVRDSEQMRKLGTVSAVAAIAGGLAVGFMAPVAAAVVTILGSTVASAALWRKLSDDRVLEGRRGAKSP